MGTESIYERENTIKASITFKDSAGNATDPSGNMAFIQVIDSDGNDVVSSTSGSRTGTGAFEYYFNTDSTDPLGLYIIKWHGYHNVGTVGGINYGYQKITERDVIRIVDPEQ